MGEIRDDLLGISIFETGSGPYLDDKTKEAMEYAFYEDLWNKKGELEPFLENANHCWKKEGIQLKRRLTTYGGESNRPIFWKKEKKDDVVTFETVTKKIN